MRYVPGPVPNEFSHMREFLEQELKRISEICAAFEVGYWTPVLFGTTTAGAHTYGVQRGRWWTFGSKVFLDFRVELTAKDAAMAGNVQISGIPFPAANPFPGLRFANSVIAIGNVTLGANYTHVSAAVLASGTAIQLDQNGSGQVQANITAAMIANTSFLFGSLAYERTA